MSQLKRKTGHGSRKIVHTFASAAAARLFASFSAFFARPLSFFAFPPFGAIVVSTWLLSDFRGQVVNKLRVIDYRVRVRGRDLTI